MDALDVSSSLLTPPPSQTEPPAPEEEEVTISTLTPSLPTVLPMGGVPSIPFDWLEHFKEDPSIFGISLLSPKFLGSSWKGNLVGRFSAAGEALEVKVKGMSWLRRGEALNCQDISALREHVKEYPEIYRPFLTQIGEYDRDIREALHTKAFREILFADGFRNRSSRESRFYGGDHALMRYILLDRLLWAGCMKSTGIQRDAVYQLPLEPWTIASKDPTASDTDIGQECRYRQPFTRTEEWLKAGALALVHLGVGLSRSALTEENMTGPDGQGKAPEELDRLLITSIQTSRRVSHGLHVMAHFSEAVLGLRALMFAVRLRILSLWAATLTPACFLLGETRAYYIQW